MANIAGMAGPYFTKIAIDDLIPSGNVPQLLSFGWNLHPFLVLIGWCMRYRIYAITEVGQDILKDMRYDIFAHLQRLPFAYFDNRPHGKI